jgi:hypothetical protein
MAMLGYGTALKILFLNENRLATSLERNEIVAFINTIGKFSESMRQIRELTNMYWDNTEPSPPPTTVVPSPTDSTIDSVDLVDTAVGLVASLARGGNVETEREAELVRLSLARNADLLILAKHYGNDMHKFLAMTNFIGSVGSADDFQTQSSLAVDWPG